MAKKKRSSRTQGMFSKAVNIGLTALAFSKAITIWISAAPVNTKVAQTLQAYTGFGLDGSFVPTRLIEGYAPVAGAFAIGTVLKFIRRKFPVR